MYKSFHIINSAHPCTELIMDTNLVRTYLLNAGLTELTGSRADEADLVIVSTCAYNIEYENNCIKNMAHAQNMVYEQNAAHKQSTAHEQSTAHGSDKKIIVLGCLPKINPDLYKNYDFPVLNPGALDYIEKIVPSDTCFSKIKAPLVHLEEYKNNPLFMKGIKLKKFFQKISAKLPFIKTPSWLDTVPMTDWYFIRPASGCTGNCTFCAVKRARGNIKSIPFEQIKPMVQEAAKLGFKEISLAGDDMGCYGIDINSSLAELLTQILAVSSDFVINIRFVEPFWLIKGLSDLYPLFKTGRVKSFCVPLQSGSQSVLDRMNRNYDINEAVNAVNYVIDKTNVNSISSIVMAGFPGETSEDFEKTLDLLNICRANLYQVLKYEERPGTPSADMSGKIDEKTKDVRVKAFTKKMKRLKFANLSEFIWRSK